MEALAAAPQDTDAYRQRLEALLRGDVPLDPENLEATLRLQYDLQVQRLASLALLEETQEGERFLTAVDGKRYPLPPFDEVLARVDARCLRERLTQGFDSLLLVPFGLPLDRVLDGWRAGLRRNVATVGRVGRFDAANPVWV